MDATTRRVELLSTPQGDLQNERRRYQVHGIVYPLPVAPGQGISATVDDQKVLVAELSPFGAVLVEEGGLELGEVGQTIECLIHVESESTYRLEAKVIDRMPIGDITQVGVNWSRACVLGEDALPSGDNELPERDRRFAVGNYARPTGTFEQPLKGEVHFELENVSAQGAAFTTSLRNNLLLPGIGVTATLRFPKGSPVKLRMIMKHMRVIGTEESPRLRVGVEFQDISPEAASQIAQHIYEFSPEAPSPKEMKASKLPLDAFDTGLSYDDVRTEQEYKAVLELRSKAYGMYNDDCSVAVMTRDTLDANNKVLAVRHRGQMIATGLVSLPQDGEALQVEEYAPCRADLPESSVIVEVGRVCTHPDYRGKDVLVALFRHVLLRSVQAGRRWLVSTCPLTVLPIYQWVGAQKLDYRFPIPELKDDGTVFKLDMYKTFTGHGIGTAAWLLIYRDGYRSLSKERRKELGPLSLRARFADLFAPILLRIIARRATRKKKRR